MVDRGREIARKLVHAVIGLTLLVGVRIAAREYGTGIAAWWLATLLAGALLVDFLMARYDLHLPVYYQLERSHERHAFHGPTWLLLGMLATLLLYPLTIALAAMSLVFFGDAAATIAGMLVPQPKLVGKKSLAGSLAMLGVGFIAAFIVLRNPAAAAMMAGTGMLVELVTGPTISDNVTVPVIAGFIGSLLL
jgi:dolichol kinase